MKLYHGTRESAVSAILTDGLKPRGKKGGNWKHSIESNPSAVYLTNAYAIYFAGNAAIKDKTQDRLVVLEIDTAKLNPFRLAPDEDFLEQATRKEALENLAPIDKPMKYRTRWYRRRLLQFAKAWEQSVEHMGTCTYHGVIPSNAITRIAFIEPKSYAELVWFAGIDPMITILNYSIMGPKYRNSIKRLFGDTDIEEEPFGEHKLAALASMPEEDRVAALAKEQTIWTNGIEVKQL